MADKWIDRFQVTLTSRTHMPSEEFKKEILHAAQEMRELFESSQHGESEGKSRL
jgi:hypothetical protein